MRSIDILFGVRAAAAVGSLSVAIAFHECVCRFVRDGLFGRGYSDRLGAGIGMIATGTASINLIQLAGMVLGMPLLERVLPAPLVIALGLGVSQCGYYLAFTAWLAATKRGKIKRVALIWAASLSMTAVTGMTTYPFIRP